MHFVTSNEGKYLEIKRIFEDHDFSLSWIKLNLEEPRGSLDFIARQKALKAYERLGKSLFVEDTGLFIDGMGEFPGPYTGWVVRNIGIERLVRLFDEGQPARFKTVVAYVSDGNLRLFEGVVEGRLTKTPRGSSHSSLPYDSIFIPEGSSLTFAEDPSLKIKYSHRRRAVEQLLRFLRNEY